MADSKITDLTALTGANLATGDQFVAVDVSDTTMSTSGTDKKMTAGELLNGLSALGAVQVVVHGSTAATARPSAATMVLWIGSATPTNAATNDEWTDTTNKVVQRYTGSAWVLLWGRKPASAGTNGFDLTRRDDVTSFPVPVFRPVSNSMLCAYDVMPNDVGGRPTDGGNGASWSDWCDQDLINNNAIAVSCARASTSGSGATIARVEFGNYTFNGGTEKNIELTHNGRTGFRIYPHASSVNFIGIQAASTGSGPVLAAVSDTDTNVDLIVQAQGTGVVNFGNATTTTTAPSAGAGGALPATPAGYMTVKVSGTSRKVAYY